jgi:hypothetical protein
MKITLKSVIPACFKQESILFWHGFPIKTVGNDKLQHPLGESDLSILIVFQKFYILNFDNEQFQS